jgi:hypothetical protein
MSETIGRLLAAGNVAEVFEWGSRVVKLYRSSARIPTVFREAANHASVEAMALPVPVLWGVLEVGGAGVCIRPCKGEIVCRAHERGSEPAPTRPRVRAPSAKSLAHYPAV